MTGINFAILPSGGAAETKPEAPTATEPGRRRAVARVDWNVLTKKRERFLRQQWSTPQNFRAVLNREFFPDPEWALDPCALPRNKVFPHYLCPPTGPDYSRTDPLCLGRNALKCSWQGRPVYCNPGFRDLDDFVPKCHEEALKGSMVVLMAHVSGAADWWEALFRTASEIRFLRPRVQFEPPPGIDPSSNARDNIVAVFRPREVRDGLLPACWVWEWLAGAPAIDVTYTPMGGLLPGPAEGRG